MDGESVITALGREGDSKMSGEQSPLEVLCTHDMTQR